MNISFITKVKSLVLIKWLQVPQIMLIIEPRMWNGYILFCARNLVSFEHMSL
jgi:hypothetical protein